MGTRGAIMLAPGGARILRSNKRLLSDGQGNDCCCNGCVCHSPGSCTRCAILTTANLEPASFRATISGGVPEWQSAYVDGETSSPYYFRPLTLDASGVLAYAGADCEWGPATVPAIGFEYQDDVGNPYVPAEPMTAKWNLAMSTTSNVFQLDLWAQRPIPGGGIQTWLQWSGISAAFFDNCCRNHALTCNGFWRGRRRTAGFMSSLDDSVECRTGLFCERCRDRMAGLALRRNWAELFGLEREDFECPREKAWGHQAWMDGHDVEEERRKLLAGGCCGGPAKDDSAAD